MRNTDPHHHRERNNPASNGPNAETPPPIADHSAMPFVRRGPLQSAVMSDNVVG